MLAAGSSSGTIFLTDDRLLSSNRSLRSGPRREYRCPARVLLARAGRVSGAAMRPQSTANTIRDHARTPCVGRGYPKSRGWVLAADWSVPHATETNVIARLSGHARFCGQSFVPGHSRRYRTWTAAGQRRPHSKVAKHIVETANCIRRRAPGPGAGFWAIWARSSLDSASRQEFGRPAPLVREVFGDSYLLCWPTQRTGLEGNQAGESWFGD